jgi:hypothetical protein
MCKRKKKKKKKKKGCPWKRKLPPHAKIRGGCAQAPNTQAIVARREMRRGAVHSLALRGLRAAVPARHADASPLRHKSATHRFFFLSRFFFFFCRVFFGENTHCAKVRGADTIGTLAMPTNNFSLSGDEDTHDSH